MKTQSKPKLIKNKIPFCPRKIKPVKKIIRINPEIKLMKNNKNACTPKILLSKKFEIKKDIIIKNPFRALILKRNSHSEKKNKNQNIILIKKSNNNYKNLNNSKSETKCDTNIGLSSVFNDANKNQRNKNVLEFTFSKNYSFKINNKKNNINLKIKTNEINKTNINFSYHKNNNNLKIWNIKKIIGMNNIKLINKRNNSNDKNMKINGKKILIKRNFSRVEKEKIKNKNKIKDYNNKKKKNNSKINNTCKIFKKFFHLIPYDKKKQIKKKPIYIKTNTDINNDFRNKNKINISNTTKSEDNNNKIYKLLFNIPLKKLKRENKSNPKLLVKHPSLKRFFDV